ncbi:non-hydrolyzing UDP-N-acetylglucosamine 2-epimerase [Desulfobacter curvatus]|uniref:non-hydrolyzing UDP-N-acetylglucosamine 2-epimerase n=1 Tax=Desulfobacter curvatus TaxID=2290 RepID=UPI00037CB8DE|nr:UDP-N-acetylglucosamine 2-epimerase (non-hydrolyzing) [Desulfobacter curvatus]
MNHILPLPDRKLKVMTVIGTRPEIIRLSRVMATLDEHMNHVIVHTGQNYDYELNQIFFDDLGIRKPDYFLNSAEPGNSACQTVGAVIAKVDDVLAQVEPDALLVLGDTNSCLAAYPAKRRKVPVFHMEAGNRCFDQRVPEEINRKIIDHISDINLSYSDIAREYLLREGFPPERVIKTGSPMFEVLNFYRDKIDASDVLERLNLHEAAYFVVSAHREENIDDPAQFADLMRCLDTIAEVYGVRIIVSTHPRTRKRMETNEIAVNSLVEFMKPLGFFDYVHLQTRARATLSDSGTISEESSILNFPALNIRNAHERPEAMEEAAVMLTGLKPERILQGLNILDSQSRSKIDKQHRIVNDYQMPNVSEKVLRIILSYSDYVNRYVWHK